MRTIFLFLCFILIGFNSISQLPPDQFLWKAGGKEIKGETFITGNASKQYDLLIFFLPDSVQSSSIEDAFKRLPDSIGDFVLIRVHVPNGTDSNAYDFFHRMANDLSKDIIPGLKRYKGISMEKIIVAGFNEGALVALYCAAASERKLKRTGMFISGFRPFAKLKAEIDPENFDLRGKLFVYNKKEREEDVSADEFCDALALRDDLLICKKDSEDDSNFPNTFNNFIRWMMTEGSNYVFESD